MAKDKQQKLVFVTSDRFLLEKGNIDPVDEEIMKEAAHGGELTIMSTAEALENMKKEKPEKFKELKNKFEGQAGKALTMDEIADLGRQGRDRKAYYDRIAGPGMTKDQALEIRFWRTQGHYSWRAVARAAFGMVMSNGWHGWMLWDPPSNQLMGIALCERAAGFFGENYRYPPWN